MKRIQAGMVAAVLGLAGCGPSPEDGPRATGYVDATEVRVASRVPGRVRDVQVVEGAEVAPGDLLVRLSPAELDLAITRARAERDQATAQQRLLEAGARPEEIAQLRAQQAAAEAERVAAASELEAARTDAARFEQLLENRAGSVKQRDDAVARRRLAEARLVAATERREAAAAALGRAEAGARAEEIAAARARVAAVDAQIAQLEHDRSDLEVSAPGAGIVTSRLVEPGELVSPGQPLVVLLDLAHAWVNAYVEEPIVPTLRINAVVTVVTDAGDRLDGRVAFIAPQPEFTPRNVQTAEERARLVYRVKVMVDNRDGVLKPGMPVEVELGGA